MPSAHRRVPSSGSTAMSTLGSEPSPTSSPLASIGASSFSPSPITTMPSMWIVWSTACMPSTAAWSAASLSPRPIQRALASAAASVTRTSSSARLRSGAAFNSQHPRWLASALDLRRALGSPDHHQHDPEQGQEPAELEADLGARLARAADDALVEHEADRRD